MQLPKRTFPTKRGFNLIEVLIAVFILIFMALMFAAVVPTTLRSVHTSNYYNLAALIAQRKVDQLMDPAVGFANLTTTSLKGGTSGVPQVLSSGAANSDACGWTDPAPTSTGTLGRTDYHLVGYFTQIDGLREYYNDGSAACANASSQNSFPGESEVVGRMDVEGWEGRTAAATNTSMAKVTITITWRVRGQGVSTYTLVSLVPESKIL